MSILHLSPFPLHRLLMPFKSSSNVWRHSRVDKGTWNHRALPKVVALLLRTFQLSHLYLIETYRGGFPPFMDEEFNMTMSNSWTLNGARSRAHLQESEWGAPGLRLYSLGRHDQRLLHAILEPEKVNPAQCQVPVMLSNTGHSCTLRRGL